MSIKNELGGLLGSSPTDIWTNGSLSNAPATLGGASIGSIGGYDIREIERVMGQQKDRRDMIESGDLIVRKVRNGYKVIVANGPGIRVDEYIATDIEHVHEVVKLALVNYELDAAK